MNSPNKTVTPILLLIIPSEFTVPYQFRFVKQLPSKCPLSDWRLSDARPRGVECPPHTAGAGGPVAVCCRSAPFWHTSLPPECSSNKPLPFFVLDPYYPFGRRFHRNDPTVALIQSCTKHPWLAPVFLSSSQLELD